LERDYELAAQLEATFATSPGALAGADFFKSRTRLPFKRAVSRYDRDNDMDNDQASVVSTQKGRERGSWSITGDIIPAGAATPTKPDMDLFLEAHLGTAKLATAHTTLASGSTATVLNFTAGGVAASGTAVGDLIAVNVDATFGYEVREVITIATDAVTVDRALSAAPAAAQAVKTGATFRLSEAQLKTLHIWGYLNGNNFRHKMGGCIVRDLAMDIDFSGETPVATINVSGEGQQLVTHTTSRPTPVTAGQPLLPSEGKCWLGTALTRIVKAGIKSNNGIDLRAVDSTSLLPTGVKRTGNKGRYMVTQALDLLITDATSEGYFDNAASLSALDVIVQLGVTPGQIVAWRTRNWIPDGDVSGIGEEAAISLAGRAYATAAALDSEVVIAFL
jgi:hypothetical protein